MPFFLSLSLFLSFTWQWHKRKLYRAPSITVSRRKEQIHCSVEQTRTQVCGLKNIFRVNFDSIGAIYLYLDVIAMMSSTIIVNKKYLLAGGGNGDKYSSLLLSDRWRVFFSACFCCRVIFNLLEMMEMLTSNQTEMCRMDFPLYHRKWHAILTHQQFTHTQK